MGLLETIYKRVLDEARASENKINQAIDRHQLVIIRYNTHGEHIAMANRLCGVFAYGTTKAGNPCIRVFEYEGDTSTFVPAWKLIRLDRILAWYPTKRTYDSPPGNADLGEFNPNGDNSMSMVYKVAQFDGTPTPIPQGTQPKTASSVKGGQRQSQKQSYDLKKAQDGLKPYQTSTDTHSNEPKTAQDVKGQQQKQPSAMDYLRNRLGTQQQQAQMQPSYSPTQNVKQTQPTAQKPLERQGLEGEYANKPLRKTDTENAMDYLRKQLENPEKIDLAKVPRK